MSLFSEPDRLYLGLMLLMPILAVTIMAVIGWYCMIMSQTLNFNAAAFCIGVSFVPLMIYPRPLPKGQPIHD